MRTRGHLSSFFFISHCLFIVVLFMKVNNSTIAKELGSVKTILIRAQCWRP